MQFLDFCKKNGYLEDNFVNKFIGSSQTIGAYYSQSVSRDDPKDLSSLELVAEALASPKDANAVGSAIELFYSDFFRSLAERVGQPRKIIEYMDEFISEVEDQGSRVRSFNDYLTAGLEDREVDDEIKIFMSGLMLSEAPINRELFSQLNEVVTIELIQTYRLAIEEALSLDSLNAEISGSLEVALSAAKFVELIGMSCILSELLNILKSGRSLDDSKGELLVGVDLLKELFTAVLSDQREFNKVSDIAFSTELYRWKHRLGV